LFSEKTIQDVANSDITEKQTHNKKCQFIIKLRQTDQHHFFLLMSEKIPIKIYKDTKYKIIRLLK